tara:strand:+ start:1065 stop:1379 length:315 start_codon:yes stop_codon:yes gene_type:complete
MSTITTSLSITAQFAEMYLVAFECTDNDIVTMSSDTYSSGAHLRLNARTIKVVKQLVAQNGTGNWGNVTDVVVTTCDMDYTPKVKFNYDGFPFDLVFSHQRQCD